MNKVRARIKVRGIVQGVFFRATMAEAARGLGVCGWVKNNPDGTVEAVAEGEEEAVKKLIEWCHKGPPLARVDGVDVSWEACKDEFDDFIPLTRHNTY